MKEQLSPLLARAPSAGVPALPSDGFSPRQPRHSAVGRALWSSRFNDTSPDTVRLSLTAALKSVSETAEGEQGKTVSCFPSADVPPSSAGTDRRCRRAPAVASRRSAAGLRPEETALSGARFALCFSEHNRPRCCGLSLSCSQQTPTAGAKDTRAGPLSERTVFLSSSVS